jgi:hypothetical protein
MTENIPHIFNVSLGVDLAGKTWASVRSLDGSISTRFEAGTDITGMFPCGVSELTCRGYLDGHTSMIMLGTIIDSPEE